MNFYWVYDLPNWLFCLLTIVSFVTFSLAGQKLTRRASRRLLGDADHNDLVGHYLAAFGVFYGITLGLISVGTWENFSDVETKVAQEAASVAALYRDVSSYPEPKRTELTDRMREYTRYVIEEAWPQQQRGIVPKGGTERITSVQQSLVAFEPATEGQKALHAEALRQFNHLIELRRLRLQSVTAGLPATLWLVIFAGAIMNISLTWLFVTENKLLHDLLTGLLAALIGLLVFMLAAMDNPFRGEYSVSAEAFQLVFDQLMKK